MSERQRTEPDRKAGGGSSGVPSERGTQARSGRLQGVRVLVTRPRERAQPLCFLLEDEGAEVVALPMLEFEPPADRRPLQAAAELLRRFEWVAFASERAVAALVEAAQAAGTLEILRTRSLAAVGPGTAAALTEHGLTASLVASVSTGAGLAQALLPRLQPRATVLLPAAETGHRALEQALRDAGVEVARVPAYRTTVTGEPEGWSEVRARPPRCALFGSPRTVQAFLALPGAAELLPALRAVAVGPTTAATLSERGWPAAAVARAPTAPEWVEAVVLAMAG